MSASFSFKVYTERWANVLASEWAHRLQYFYDLPQGDDGSEVCSDAAVAAYSPTPAFLQAREAVPGAEHRFHNRAAQLAELRPRRAP